MKEIDQTTYYECVKGIKIKGKKRGEGKGIHYIIMRARIPYMDKASLTGYELLKKRRIEPVSITGKDEKGRRKERGRLFLKVMGICAGLNQEKRGEGRGKGGERRGREGNGKQK